MSLDPGHISAVFEAAIEEANNAFEKGEVPVGAVISNGREIIARAHNLVETLQDATAHAEILAIRAASKQLENWRLMDAILCVTLEPCTMCMGAIKNSRIPTLFFGAYDQRAGACGSVYDLSIDSRTGLVPTVVGGVQESRAVELLKRFFQGVREQKKGYSELKEHPLESELH